MTLRTARLSWLFAGLALVPSLEAQELRVLVRESGSAKPATGALVSLVGADHRTIATGIANELGRLRLSGPAGPAVVRIERPGLADTSVAVTLGTVDSIVVVLGTVRVGLPTSFVAAPAACQTPGLPAALGSAWAEARKTLQVVAAGEDQSAATLSLTAFERALSLSLKVESQQINTLLGPANRPPNVGPGAERNGYLTRGDSLAWTAPDVVRFASDEFLQGHCFGWVAGIGEREGMAGLQFVPPGGRTAALAGTMWFDPPTRELRVIDYRFSGIPELWRPERAGGSLEIHRSDPGLWVTRFWYQRVPVVRLAAGNGKDRLLGFREAGAEVTAVEPTVDTTDRAATARAIARQAALARGRFARLIGTVVDSLGVPIPEADVAVVGTELATQTNATGQFVLSGLPLGLQVARIRKIGFKARFFPLRLAAGQDWEGRITIARMPMLLGEIMVVGKYGKPPQYANTAKYDDFYRRRSARIGKFVTRDEIDRQNSSRIADLIRGIPGVRTSFNPVGGNDAVEFDGCAPDGVGVWVDGQRLSGDAGEILPLITARDVEAVEVYQRQNQIPPEYQDGACAAIVLWTR